jgi:hypothetical protein
MMVQNLFEGGIEGKTKGRGVNLRGAQRFFLINPVKIILFKHDAGLLLMYPLFSMIATLPDGMPRGG